MKRYECLKVKNAESIRAWDGLKSVHIHLWLFLYAFEFSFVIEFHSIFAIWQTNFHSAIMESNFYHRIILQ